MNFKVENSINFKWISRIFLFADNDLAETLVKWWWIVDDDVKVNVHDTKGRL